MERRQEGGVERPGVEAGDHRHEQRRGLGIDADCDTAAGGRSRHPPRSLLQHSSPRCCLRPTFHPQCRTHQGSTSSYHELAADTSLRRRRNCSPLSIQELRGLSGHFLFFSDGKSGIATRHLEKKKSGWRASGLKSGAMGQGPSWLGCPTGVKNCLFFILDLK